ncbi:TolC family protein [Marivirga lumbricoides]|uniref:TolC family protein n=1 Tax=Marivirga lumbricoides TaxID=1046115 RepID=A0A2T4DS55_9BACT|nr:TolC family protein [Marivirga lumbricoides]
MNLTLKKLNMKKVKYLLFSSLFLILYVTKTANAQEQLDEYLALAVKNNPAVKSAYAQFEAALQKSPQVTGLPDPTLTVSAFGRMIETRLGTQEARFSFMQMFPWFGTNKAKSEVANLIAEASFQNYLEVRKQVIFDVTSAYVELYALTEIIKLKEEDLKILNAYKELAISRFESGKAPMVNAVKVDIQKDAALAEIEWLKEELKPIQTKFNLLTAREVQSAINVVDTLFIEDQNPLLENEMELLENHPSIKALKQKEASYGYQEQVAKKEGFPNIGLGLDYSIISKRPVDDLERNGQDAIMPMVSLSLPVYRKKYRASAKEAQLMEESLIHQQESQMNSLVNEYQSALYELNKAKKQVALYDRQIKSAAQANKLLVSGFSNDLTDFDEVLQMNQDVLMYKTQKIEAIKNALIAKANLEYLLSKSENNENEY